MTVTPLGGSAQEYGPTKVTRSPDGRVFDGYFYSTPVPGNKVRFTQVWLSGEAFAELASATAFRIKAGPVDLNLSVAKSAKAIAALHSCEDGLLTDWGIRPAAYRNGTPPSPKADVTRYFRSSVYPSSAVFNGHIGQVRAAIVVGADGVVKDCKVMTKIGSEFDAVTCTQARKVPFTPGLDETGKPTQSLYNLNVRWSMGN